MSYLFLSCTENFLLTNKNIRCKNKTQSNVSYSDCGATATGSESW